MTRLDPDHPLLAAPDFPHGELRGYARGCSCVGCRSANAEATARRKARVEGRPVGQTQGSRVDATAALDHIRTLLAADPLVTPKYIAAAAGVNATVVSDLLAGHAPRISCLTEEYLMGVSLDAARSRLAKTRRPAGPTRDHIRALLQHPLGTYTNIAAATGLEPINLRSIAEDQRIYVYAETASAVAGVTAEILERRAAFVPARIPRMQIRALQAQGFTLMMLTTLSGQKGNGLSWVKDRSAVVRQDIARRTATLYNEIGDREGPSQRTKSWARRNGYYPSIHYDEDMNLIPGSIPDGRWEPFTASEDWPRTNLRIMGLTLREYNGPEIADRVGYSEKKVERIRRKIGLRLEPNARNSVLLDYIKPGQDALVSLIRTHVEHIALNEALPVVDQPGLDYAALWESLVAGAEQLRTAAWIPTSDLASVA